jgi:integrase
LREKSARISVRSFIHRARSLFTANTVARIRDLVEIPERLPFSGIEVETVHGPRYRATFDMVELLESARDELATEHPEQYKIFLLGAMAGLRRNEIDVLPWSAFQWSEGAIRIETTEHYRPKSHNSEGDVRVDPELLELFRGYYARRKSEFVIESDSPRRPSMRPMGFIAA